MNNEILKYKSNTAARKQNRWPIFDKDNLEFLSN